MRPLPTNLKVTVVLLLFDYDGVIVDSFDLFLELCERVRAEFGHARESTPHDLQTIENLTFTDMGRLLGVPENKLGEYNDRLMAIQKAYWPVTFFPEMIDVLNELAKQHTVAVVTSSDSETVFASLRNVGLGDAITAVLGGDLGNSKAERINMLRAKHGFECHETVMTGDAISDVRQGKLAGVVTVAVTWGYQNKTVLAKENPDFILDRPEELLRIPAKLINSKG